MTTRALPQLGALLAIASLTLLAQCRPEPSPPPTPSPTEEVQRLKDQWGAIVLYERSGQCVFLATPPRINAGRGEKIIWRIYNACTGRKEAATVTITQLSLVGPPNPSTPPREYFPGLSSYEKKGQPLDPFDPADPKTKQVAPGRAEDLTLRVRRDAEKGLYTYQVKLNGKPDEDQEIDIHH